MEAFPVDFCPANLEFIPEPDPDDLAMATFLGLARKSIVLLVKMAHQEHKECVIVHVSRDGNIISCQSVDHALSMTTLEGCPAVNESRPPSSFDPRRRNFFLKTLADELSTRFGSRFKVLLPNPNSWGRMEFMPYIKTQDAPVSCNWRIDFKDMSL